MRQDHKETDYQQVDLHYWSYSEFYSAKDKALHVLSACCVCGCGCLCLSTAGPKHLVTRWLYSMLCWLCQLVMWKGLGQHIQPHCYCIGSSLANKLRMSQSCPLQASGPQSGSSVTITTFQKKVVATAVFPGEHRGARGCSQITYIISDTVGRIVVYAYRLHSPAVEILMALIMAGYDPEELNYVRVEEYLLAKKQNLQCRGKNGARRCLETGAMSGSRPTWAVVEGNTITQENQQCSLHPWPPLKATDAEQVNTLPW